MKVCYPSGLARTVDGVALPQWLNGDAGNLAAAAFDALEWLRYFQGCSHRLNHEGDRNLAGAIEALERLSGAVYRPVYDQQGVAA